MIFFIIVLVVCILVFFASIIYGLKTYVKAKKNKTLNEDERKSFDVIFSHDGVILSYCRIIYIIYFCSISNYISIKQ